ncbi:hypothetical protein SAMN04488122_5524 [Chitinophaga arvensicola]|uniref:Uncharacterized protein n=1 Tax=Chitinophaga arvensicola TaxID=29529 RepID=A0A1I0SCJ1_9BACT|nr:hypothetical protein SAMN04488122_5524 [Chitinophaga arvensicola]
MKNQAQKYSRHDKFVFGFGKMVYAKRKIIVRNTTNSKAAVSIYDTAALLFTNEQLLCS